MEGNKQLRFADCLIDSSAMALDRCSRLLVRSVLETTIDRLAIVASTLPKANGQQKQQVGAHHEEPELELVHHNDTEDSLDELLLRDLNILQRSTTTRCSKAMALRLLSLEVDYIQRVLEATLTEVSEDGTYAAIVDSTRKSTDRANEMVRMSESESVVGREIGHLQKAVEAARDRAEMESATESLLIAHLKDQLLEARRATRGEEAFVKQLEAVRQEGRAKALETVEKNMVEHREELKREIEYDQRVTLEMESFLGDRRSHLKELHHFWTEKMKAELTQKDVELAELVAEREADQRRRDEAEARLAASTKFVRDEIERRERIRVEKEQRELQVRMAIRIQSWWRMTMVRRGLGPFRKKLKQAKKKK